MRPGVACIVGWVAGLLAGGALAGVAGAAELEVASLADSGPGTLRAALATAEANGEPDLISITATGTIELDEPLPALTTEVEIAGPGRARLRIQPAAGAPHETFRLLEVAPGAEVLVRELTLAGGWDRYPFGAAGGAVLNLGALRLVDVAVRDSEAATGENFHAEGGAIASEGELVLRRSLLAGNTAAGGQAQGGAIHSRGSLIVRRSALRGNVADAPPGGGAGAALYLAGEAGVARSELSGNAVPGGAGEPGQSSFPPAAILNETAELELENSTLSGNDGGIAAWSASRTVVRSSTLVAAPGGSPNIASVAIDVTATFELQNTVLARASAASGAPNCAPAAQTVIVSEGHNLADDASCAFLGPRDLSAVPAGLLPLTERGPTRVHRLRACSAATDAGASAGLRRDQLGARRPVGRARRPHGDGADIGAFERQGPPCNRFSARAHRTARGAVVVALEVPGPGAVRLTSRGIRVRRAHPRAARTVRLRLLRRQATGIRRIRVGYRPLGGRERTKRVRVRAAPTR